MNGLPVTLCKHLKLLVKLKVSSTDSKKVAIITCKFCGFSVEAVGDSLTEPELKMAFNAEARNLRLGRKHFSL